MSDAVHSSGFITYKKSSELINNLKGIASVRIGKKLVIEVPVESIVKTVNVKVMLSTQAYVWLFGLFNKVKIISLSSAAERYGNI